MNYRSSKNCLNRKMSSSVENTMEPKRFEAPAEVRHTIGSTRSARRSGNGGPRNSNQNDHRRTRGPPNLRVHREETRPRRLERSSARRREEFPARRQMSEADAHRNHNREEILRGLREFASLLHKLPKIIAATVFEHDHAIAHSSTIHMLHELLYELGVDYVPVSKALFCPYLVEHNLDASFCF